ncbi:MAG: hypothetical protein IJH48_09525 [Oscillospiraceae bacterium]|nr:hypothetical protein [Oscillospiraceae bacterium]
MRDLGANNYEAARSRLRTVMIAAALSCAGSLLTPQSYLPLKLFFTIATILIFASMVFIIVRECRCPHCGKIIFLGALSATHCPRCRRSLTTGKKQKKSRK